MRIQSVREHIYITLRYASVTAEGKGTSTSMLPLHAMPTLCLFIQRLMPTNQHSWRHSQCFIHPPLGIRIFSFWNKLMTGPLPEHILKLDLIHLANSESLHNMVVMYCVTLTRLVFGGNIYYTYKPSSRGCIPNSMGRKS